MVNFSLILYANDVDKFTESSCDLHFETRHCCQGTFFYIWCFHVSSLSSYIDLLHATNKGLRTNLLLFNICDLFCGPHLWVLFSSLDVHTLLFFFSFSERVFFYKINFGNVSHFCVFNWKPLVIYVLSQSIISYLTKVKLHDLTIVLSYL